MDEKTHKDLESTPVAPEEKAQEKPVTHRITRQNRIFIQEIASGCSGAEAVRKAGYKAKNPRSYAHQLILRPEITIRIDTIKKELAEKYEVTRETLLKEAVELKEKTASDNVELGCLRLKGEITGNIKPHENKQTIILVNAQEKAILTQYGLNKGEAR